MSQAIKITRAQLSLPAHAEAVVLLLDIYARDPMGGGEGLGEYAKQNLAQELEARSNAHAVLAFVGGDPAGLAICLEGFSTFACKPLLNIHDVIVAPQHRGLGLCTKMFAEVEALAKELGCCKLTLEVLEGNETARQAYSRFGFNPYELDPGLGRAMFWEKRL